MEGTVEKESGGKEYEGEGGEGVRGYSGKRTEERESKIGPRDWRGGAGFVNGDDYNRREGTEER